MTTTDKDTETRGRSLEQITEDLAAEIYHNATNSRSRLKQLLIELAEEIKREAIEP